eukprot:6477553-Amphidinium_carterae.3
MEKKTPKSPRKDGGEPRANASATASAAAKSPAKKGKKKDGKDGKIARSPRTRTGRRSLLNDLKPVKQPYLVYLKVKRNLTTLMIKKDKLQKLLKNLRVSLNWKKKPLQTVKSLLQKNPP